MKYISTIGMPHKRWLELRKESIGGSDAAAVLGFSKYRTPTDVWISKTARSVMDMGDNVAMWLGHYLEPMVVDRFIVDKGIKVRQDHKFRYHPEYDFIHHNLDGVVSAHDESGPGVFEAKTIKSAILDYYGYDVPTDYFLQCQHGMAVTGYQYAWIAMYIKDKDEFFYKKIFRNEALISQMIEKYKDFWLNHVEKRKTPPPIDSSDLEKMYKQAVPRSKIVANEEIAEAVKKYSEVHEEYKEKEQQKNDLQFAIARFMEDNELLVDPEGNILASNKNRSQFDEEGFTKSYPNLASKYQKLDATAVRKMEKALYEEFKQPLDKRTLRIK